MYQPASFLHTFCIIGAMLFGISGHAQSTNVRDDFDFLTAEWLEVSGELKTYGGLKRYCTSPDFRQKCTDILDLIHYYDTLVLEVLLDPTIDVKVSHREYKHTVRDIQEFEEEYGISAFHSYLKESCGTWRKLETSKKELMKLSGMYSYDGQRQLMESNLRKYLKHIDKKLLAIDDHIHLIRIDEIRPSQPVSESQQ